MFHFGIPGADLLRVVMNCIDPALFQACFAPGRPRNAWCWPSRRWTPRRTSGAPSPEEFDRLALKGAVVTIAAAITCAPPPSRRPAWPRPYVATGALRTVAIGLPDVIFKEDQSRLRRGHVARNMAVVRHFAINPVRLAKGGRTIRPCVRLRAGSLTNSTASSHPTRVNLDSLPCGLAVGA